MELTNNASGVNWRTAAGLLVVLAAFYWLGNARTSLFDRDEPRFAQPAKEMLFARSWQDWVVPHFNGEPFFHKPPLSYWQTTLAYRLLGVNEFSARFFSGLWTAVTGVVLLVFLAKRFGTLTGLMAVVAFATSFMVIAEAKLATAEGTLGLLTLAAVLALWDVYRGEATFSTRLILWLAVGVAVLAKGPVVFIVMGGLAAALLVLDRRRGWVWQTGLWWGVPMALAVGLPWYFVADHLTGGKVVERFVEYDLLARARQPLESHRGFPGFYVLTGLLDAWPWSAFLAPVAAFAWANRREDNVKFLLAWLIGPTLLLECVRTKMIHYWLVVLPAYVILLALAARVWLGEPDGRSWRKWNWPVLGTVGGVWLALAGAALAGVAYARSRGLLASVGLSDQFVWVLALVIAATLMIAAVAALLAAQRGTLAAAFAAMALGAVLVTGSVSVFLLPALEPLKLGRQVAGALQSLGGDNATYVLIGWQEPSTTVYLNPGNRPVVYTDVGHFWDYAGRPNTVVAVAGKYASPLATQEAQFRAKGVDLLAYRGRDFTRGGRPMKFYIACERSKAPRNHSSSTNLPRQRVGSSSTNLPRQRVGSCFISRSPAVPEKPARCRGRLVRTSPLHGLNGYGAPHECGG